MKTIRAFLAAAPLFFGLSVDAQTVTVGASGADFTSLQAAIDSINPTNGETDIIEIIDGGDYDEQIVIGGLEPADSLSPGTWIEDLVNQNRDPIIIRGTGADKPVIGPSDGGGLTAYSVFQNDPAGDNFNAGVAFFGKGITIENVEIRQPAGGGAYALNGQGVDLTFKDVLFKPGLPSFADQEESFFNFNNSDTIGVLFEGTANSATFEGCEFDGEMQDGSLGENTFIYYHGINEPLGIVDTFVFTGCTFKNYADNLTNLRARAPENCVVNQHMIDCTFEGLTTGHLGFSGAGEKLVDGCVFINNTNDPAINAEDINGGIIINGRSGYTGDITIKNSIFYNNGTDNAIDDPLLEARAAVILRNDGNDPDITIENCTFDTNGVGIRVIDGNTRPRTINIIDSIFSNHIAAGISGDAPSGSYVGSGNEGELTLNITNCLFFNNTFDFDIGTASGSVTGDPMFVDTETFALMDGSPAIGAASDGGNIGAWQGTSDVESYMLH